MTPSTPCEWTLVELAQEQLVRLAGRRYPFSGSFELTERCNLRCTHCFINQPAGSRAAQARQLPTQQVIAILDQIADAGCLHLLLTGGEVLLRPDFPRIYLHALRRGLLLTLFTNGTLLTPDLASFLGEWRPRSLEITLYGATETTYEHVTRVPGSHRRCLAGIELALRNGLPLALKTVVLRANQHELQDIRAFAARSGVSFRYDGVLWPRISSPPGPLSCDSADQRTGAGEVLAQRLSPEEIVALDCSDPERADEWRKLAGEKSAPARRDLVFACGAGRHGFHIDSSGKLSACIMARHPAFDLLQEGFQHGWEEGLGRAIRAERTRDVPCRSCRAGQLCSQCPGWSQAVHHDDETPVTFVCELARLREARFGAADR